jgi:VCBS repeat-containing protein
VSSSYNDDIAWSTGAVLPAGVAAALTDGTLIAAVVDAPNPGNTPWTYSAGPVDLDFLGAGQSISFSYTLSLSDGGGGGSTDTLTFTISGSNDAPTLAPVAAGLVSEDPQADTRQSSGLTGTLLADDPDVGETLRFAIQGGIDNGDTQSIAGSHGTLTLDEVSGSYTYVPDVAAIEALDEGEEVRDSFTLQVADASGAVASRVFEVVISGADDAPTLAAIGPASIAEVPLSDLTTDVGLSGTLVATDVDGEALQFAIDGVVPEGGTYSAAGSFGTLRLDAASGAYDYVKDDAAIEALAPGETGQDSFTISVSDGDGPLVLQSFVVDVTGANDAPQFSVDGGGDTGSASLSEGNAGLSAAGTLSLGDVDRVQVVSVVVDGLTLDGDSNGLGATNAELLAMLAITPPRRWPAAPSTARCSGASTAVTRRSITLAEAAA